MVGFEPQHTLRRKSDTRADRSSPERPVTTHFGGAGRRHQRPVLASAKRRPTGRDWRKAVIDRRLTKVPNPSKAKIRNASPVSPARVAVAAAFVLRTGHGRSTPPTPSAARRAVGRLRQPDKGLVCGLTVCPRLNAPLSSFRRRPESGGHACRLSRGLGPRPSPG